MGKPWSGAFFLCSLSQFAVFFFIGRAVYQKQFCQSNIQNKQRGCETEYRHMRYNLAVMHASNVCARLYKQLCVSQFVFGCVSFFLLWFSLQYLSLCRPRNTTKRNKTEQICAIIPRQATAPCLCAPLPVGPHIITAATLIHHSIVVVFAGPILSLAQQRYIKKQ